MTVYIWKGPNGYNPLIGQVTEGQEIKGISLERANKLIGEGKLVKKTTPSKKKKSESSETEE